MRPTLINVALISFFIVLMAGCTQAASVPTSSPLPAATPSPTHESLTLQFIGHACFLLTASDGTRIITDPYSNGTVPIEIAQFPSNLTSDFITISHLHSDHANIGGVNGSPPIFMGPGTHQAGTVKITGYKGDHGFVKGKPNGENTVFVFEIGDMKIVHMGEEGVISEADILSVIEDADVVMIDTMGDPAHPIPEIFAQMQKSHVRTIIPMHFGFSVTNRFHDAVTIDEFVKMVPSDVVVVRKDGSELIITSPMTQQVVILTPLALSMQK